MRFEKQITVAAPRQVVWDFLWDTARLALCVPGCEDVQEVESYKRYSATVSDRVGPFKVRVPLTIEVLETAAPERLYARANGKDAVVQSLVKIELDLALVDLSPQTTALRFRAEVSVLGRLGVLGHSIIVRRWDAIMDQFATAIQATLGQETN